VSVRVMGGVVDGLDFDRKRMRAAAGQEEMMAAGLAVALAREGLPFRKAHALVGSLVAQARQTGTTLREAAARVLPAHSPAVAARLDALFDAESSVRTRAARGGTAPDAVRASLREAVERVR
jgi:argininosuccinate lyase